jgi:hypothetical protein
MADARVEGPMTQEESLTLAWRFIEFLETGSVSDGLFAPDVF